MPDNATPDPRIAALPDIHGHAKGEHKPYAEERPIPYTARMLFLWFYHACRRSSPRFVMVADHMNYLTFEDPAAVNLVRRALKLAQAGDLYGAAETAGVELGHAAVVSEGLRRGMRYSIGAEIDNDPRCRPDAQNIVDAMKPDGMIRSVHFLPITHPQHGENWMWAFDNPEFKEFYDVVGPDNVWELYVTTLLDAIDKLPGHIVGHFYVPAKFGHWPADDVLEAYEDRFLAACHERGMAVEVNSRYFYKYFVGDDAQLAKYRAAHLRLLRKAKALGVMIAVGSDAHSPKDQGGAFDTVLALLDEAEINEIAFPIAGRLARVALRATEEILREHTAALAAVPERPAPRHAAVAAGNGTPEAPETDDDEDEDDIDDNAPLVPEETPAAVVAQPEPVADAALAAPAATVETPTVAAEAEPPTAVVATTDTAAPAAKKRSAKRPVETVVTAAQNAASSVAETVVAFAEKALETVTSALEHDAPSPTAASGEPAPSHAKKPKPAKASKALETAAPAAVVTGALATVIAARAARAHDDADEKRAARPAAKAPVAKKATANAPATKRPTAKATAAKAPTAKTTAKPAVMKAAPSKATAAKVAGTKAAAAKTPAKPPARGKAKPAKSASPARAASPAKAAPRATAAKKPAAKSKPSRPATPTKPKAPAKKAARASAPAKKAATKPVARKAAAKPTRPAAKSAAKKTTKTVGRGAAKPVAKKRTAKKSSANAKSSRARR